MPPRNDESSFEQVLARHLRRPGTSGLGGESRAGCPDAETLAAYHERALSAEEMDAFKRHIAACGRCQEVLAGVEASEHVAVREREDAHVAAQAAGRELGIEAAPRSVGAAPPKSSRIWKWTAPAAAAAAGLLVWVGVQQTRNVPRETTTVAVNTPSVAGDAGRPSPAAEEPIPTQSSDERANLSEKRAQAVASARRGARLPDGQRPAARLPSEQGGARMESDSLTAQLGTGRKRKLDEKASRQDESAKTNSYSFSRQEESKLSATTKQQAVGGEQAASGNQRTPPLPAEQLGIEGGQKEAERQFAAEDAPAKPSEYRVGQITAMEKTKRTIPEEQQKQALVDKDGGRVSADAAEANARGAPNDRKKGAAREFRKPAAAPPASLALRDAGAVFAKSAPGLVLAPDKSVLWRVGPGGMILKSLDGGETWNPQASGVSVELLAGSAPTGKVCWVVGRGGIILRTTDGEHWERLPSPAKTDIIAIEARDAQTAVVWTAEKLPKYVTRDAGKTWQRMPE